MNDSAILPQDGNGNYMLHSRRQYGDLAQVLDAAFRHYCYADVAAERAGYRDAALNAVAARRACRYEKLKAQAARLHARTVEVVRL